MMSKQLRYLVRCDSCPRIVRRVDFAVNVSFAELQQLFAVMILQLQAPASSAHKQSVLSKLHRTVVCPHHIHVLHTIWRNGCCAMKRHTKSKQNGGSDRHTSCRGHQVRACGA